MQNFYKISKFLLYAAPFALIIVTPSTLFPFIVGKYTYFKIVIELALISFILGWGFSRSEHRTKDKEQRTGSGALSSMSSVLGSLFSQPLVVAVTAFVAVFTLAGFTGINPHSSFWSNFERGEGSFLMLHFFAFFVMLLLLFTKEEDWKNLFRVSIASGVLVMLYGIAGARGWSGFVGIPICERFAGSLGNPAYIGTFSIFALFYVAYLMASGDWRSRIWQKWNLPFLIFLGLYFFVFLTLSQTRGGFLGLGVSIIMMLFYLTFRLPTGVWRRAALGSAVALILLGSLGVYYRQYINLAPWCGEGSNRILDVSISGATINTRFALWQQAVKAWQERPILGWGPENFSIAFEKYYNPVHTVWFDRAHNIFFDYLIFGGILGLLSFAGMFVSLYSQFFASNKEFSTKDIEQKNQYQNKKHSSESYVLSSQLALQRALIFALPLGYLVQGLVLFDVLPIYINLFLFLAFANYKLNLKS